MTVGEVKEGEVGEIKGRIVGKVGKVRGEELE